MSHGAIFQDRFHCTIYILGTVNNGYSLLYSLITMCYYYSGPFLKGHSLERTQDTHVEKTQTFGRYCECMWCSLSPNGYFSNDRIFWQKGESLLQGDYCIPFVSFNHCYFAILLLRLHFLVRMALLYMVYNCTLYIHVGLYSPNLNRVSVAYKH